MKICNICKLEKDLAEFNKHKSKKDGLQYYCKACDAKSSAKWRQENKEKIARYGAKYYLENKEVTAKYNAKYRLENKENICKNKAKYYQDNKEKIARYQAKYRLENKENICKNKAKYDKENPEKCRAKNRKRRAMKLQVKEHYTKEDEAFTRDLFNNECFNCGCKENLTIDHHKPLSKGFPLSRLNAVVLCKSCNSSKHDKSPEEFYLFPNLNLLNSILTRQ